MEYSYYDGTQKHGNPGSQGFAVDHEAVRPDPLAVEKIQRRAEQMHDIERRHDPSEDRDEPRQRSVRYERRSQADHEPSHQQADSGLRDEVRPTGPLGHQNGNPKPDRPGGRRDQRHQPVGDP